MKFEVLIVDDDEIVVFINERVVIDCDFHDSPNAFYNGKEALDHIINNPISDQKYFVLLDINMPVMDGWEFLEYLNQLPVCQNVAVVMVTSSTDESDKQKALKYSNVLAYFEKPIKGEKLIELKEITEFQSFFCN